MRGRAPTLCQEEVSKEGQMHTLFTKDLTLPAPDRLTDPPRDGHRGAPSQVWSFLGWCLRVLGEPEGGEGDPLG